MGSPTAITDSMGSPTAITGMGSYCVKGNLFGITRVWFLCLYTMFTLHLIPLGRRDCSTLSLPESNMPPAHPYTVHVYYASCTHPSLIAAGVGGRITCTLPPMVWVATHCDPWIMKCCIHVPWAKPCCPVEALSSTLLPNRSSVQKKTVIQW